MRVLGPLAAGLLLLGCTMPVAVPTPRPTREAGILSVTALLDLSGPRASIGAAQREALQIAADRLGTSGTRRVRVRWNAVDVAGAEARLILELRRAVVDDAVDAVIIGTPVPAYSPQLLRAIELAAVPVLLTAPAPDPPSARWLFTLTPSPDVLARLADADITARNVPLATLRLDPASEVFTEPVHLTGVRSLILSGAPREYSRLPSILRSLPVPPVVYFGYLVDPADLGEFRDLTVLWAGSRHIVGGTASDQRAAAREFVQTFAGRRGPAPSAAATTYDALVLLAGEAERRGNGTAAGLRDGLETASMAGVAALYSFTPARHAGAGVDDFTLLRLVSGVITVAR